MHHLQSENPDDRSYYESYSHFYIHEEMLWDQVWTDAYYKAIKKNAQLFQNKTVVDIGCGTGILSVFCAWVGAFKVYSVDNATIAQYAKVICKPYP